MLSILINLAAVILSLVIIFFLAFRFWKAFRQFRLQFLLILFFLGSLLGLPVYYIEMLASESTIFNLDSWQGMFTYSFLIIALFEEGMKFCLGLLLTRNKDRLLSIQQHVIVFAMLGFGFATLENILYALLFDTATIVTRILTTLPLHLCMSIIMGYFIGVSKNRYDQRSFSIAMSILVPFILHGFYDTFILQEINDTLRGIALLILAISLTICFYIFKRILRENLKHEA